VCGFGLEAVSEPEVLETVLSALVEWLNSVGSTESPPAATVLRIQDVAPNPSNGTLTFSLSVRNDVPVSITLADLGGRRVGHLFTGPWKEQIVRLPVIPSGAYLLVVTAEGAAAQTPIVVFGE
jgi:hypothetical protein